VHCTKLFFSIGSRNNTVSRKDACESDQISVNKANALLSLPESRLLDNVWKSQEHQGSHAWRTEVVERSPSLPNAVCQW